MSLFDRIKNEALNQFIEVIEWLDDSSNTMLYRFPVHNQEIKNGAKLIVRESQAAVFVRDGHRGRSPQSWTRRCLPSWCAPTAIAQMLAGLGSWTSARTLGAWDHGGPIRRALDLATQGSIA